MSDVQTMAATGIDRTGRNAAGQPRLFVLRGDPRVDGLMERLEDLGVDRFTILFRFRYPDDADVFPIAPRFRKGGRFSAARIATAERYQRALGDLVQQAVQVAIQGTDAEGQELLVEAVVVVSRDGGERGITAHTTVIITSSGGGLCNHPIELL